MPEPSEPMWRRYLRFFGPNVKGDIDEELGFHFTERIDELRAQGLAPDAAHRQALAEFGDVPAIRAELHRIDREAHRRRRRRVSVTTAVGGLGLDLRFAFRTLRVSPGLVVAAAGSLAVAVAINVTMFAAADLEIGRAHV